ncbi:hypothetical protein H9I45_12310 [Polaribacter haliotis]|uniref:Adhesin domain-containing protein n=2 Tax=Polaribacter haliotis TaxID=1888915 RepID=A0A7L8ADW5_9FLAO|nr:hypothetical protein [Polaribacter haliotis]QOD60117.1 hypothetical protein H9I45_12310 [Polaribacter haliotis]
MAVRVLLKLKSVLIESRKHSFISFFLFLLLISNVAFSQKKVTKTFQTALNKIEISTVGLDDLVIENTTSEFLEIYLYSENPNKNHIIFEEEYGIVKLRFNIPSFESEDKIFRKYITKRLNRSSAIVKVPINKNISVFGEKIGVSSKGYNGNLKIYIEEGTVKLDTIQHNLLLKLYVGNVFGNFKKANVNVLSRSGKIKIDKKFYKKKYKKTVDSSAKKIDITTVKGNIFLTSQ